MGETGAPADTDLPRYERYKRPQGGLRAERGQEAVDGGGVLDVPEQLPPPPAGDVAPLERALGVFEGDAPPPLRYADRRVVPAREQGESPVGEGQPTARLRNPSKVVSTYINRRRVALSHPRKLVV